MTNQIPFVALILLTSLLCVIGHTKEYVSAAKRTIGTQVEVAEDVIVISIDEVSHAQAFIDSIPKLKSLENVRGKASDNVLECVGGLGDSMNNVVSELKMLKELDSWSSMYRGTKSLENMVDGVVSYTDICDFALKDFDATIKLMVHRKLEDIVLLTNDVIFRVSNLQPDFKVPGKP